MRKMLLSFKPSVYNKIMKGEKIFEHRRNFPNEPILAYMYVSKPIKAITGIVYLDNRHTISEWKEIYSQDSAAIKRIEEYEKSYRFAMEILEFHETNAISLEELKHDIPNFVAPQSYIYLDNNEKLEKYIEEKIERTGLNIKHSFDKITSEQICVN